MRHVVILMQENRSFDHYFGTLPGVRGFADPHLVPTPAGNVLTQRDGAEQTRPYALQAVGRMTADGEHYRLTFRNPGTAGAVLHVYDRLARARGWTTAGALTPTATRICPCESNRTWATAGARWRTCKPAARWN